MPQPQSSTVLALIVGAGPVGLTLAAHLHHHGLAYRIIDRSPTPTDKSKALVLWARSLEMLDDLGIAERFLAAGQFLDAARLFGNKRQIARIPFVAAGTTYPRPLMIPQNETERLLTERLSEAGIRVERPVELTQLSDIGEYVVCSLRHADGAMEQVRCDWLLGCDGAHSTVRKQVGLEFTGEAEPNDWLLADCRIEGVPQDELSLFWHQQGVLVFFPFASGRCRVIGDLGLARGLDRPPDPSLADVQALVDARGPAGVVLSEPHWLAGFRIHERKVADYRRGRVILAGDAAHIHSPAGGQGMNTGMQDAWNLAWKLALVQAGRARPTLLDSYSQERGAVGEMVLRQAGRMTWAATLRNPVGQFLRNSLAGFLGKLPGFRRNFVRYLTELAVHYANSPLNGEIQNGHWPSGTVKPGDRFPDGPLRDVRSGKEQRLLKILRGPRHHLLLLPTSANDPALVQLLALATEVNSRYPNLIDTHLLVPGDTLPAGASGMTSVWLDGPGQARQQLGARATAAALIRPDGYLGYRAQPPVSDDLHKYLNSYLIAATK